MNAITYLLYLFSVSAFYMSGGLVASMAVSELKDSQKYLKATIRTMLAFLAFLVISYAVNIWLAAIISIILLISFASIKDNKIIFIAFPLIIAPALIFQDYAAMLLVSIAVFILGIIDFEKSKITLNFKNIKVKHYTATAIYLVGFSGIILLIIKTAI